MTHGASCSCRSCSPVVVVVPSPTVIDVIVPGGAQGTQSTIQVLPGQGGSRGPQGTQGVQGPIGPQGTQGISGLTLAVSYHHTQGSASNVWTITHNLNFYPNVTTMDSAGAICEGEIEHLNRNTVRVTFTSSFSGEAYLS